MAKEMTTTREKRRKFVLRKIWATDGNMTKNRWITVAGRKGKKRRERLLRRQQFYEIEPRTWDDIKHRFQRAYATLAHPIGKGTAKSGMSFGDITLGKFVSRGKYFYVLASCLSRMSTYATENKLAACSHDKIITYLLREKSITTLVRSHLYQQYEPLN